MDETSSATIDTGSSSASSATSTSPETSSSIGATGPETAASPQPTTSRPSIKDALTVFRESARQQGRKLPGMEGQPAPEGTVPAATGVETPQPPPPVANKGPIPFDVHERSMQNARAKERAAVEQEYQQKYGHPQIVERAVAWFANAAQDRVGFLANAITEAMADPQLAPHVASLVGRTLGNTRQGRTPATPAGPQPPPPDFQDGQGNQFYSARAQNARDEWLIARVREEIMGDVQPQLQTVEQMQQERQMEQQRAEVQHVMLGHLAEARTWPQFKEHEAEIKAAIAQAPLTGGHPAEEAVLLQRVYRQVVGPKLDQIQQQKWLAELKSRANAGSVNPAATGAPVGVPKNVRAKEGGTFGNALKWAAAQQSGR